jgi:cell division protein FtsL
MAAIQRPALPTPIRALPRPRSARVALVAAAGLVIGLALLQVQQFSAVTSTGYEIDELKREQLAMQAENHELEAEVAALSSLARVELVARLELGMGPPKQVLHIDVNQPVPEEQHLPSRYEPASDDMTQTPDGGDSTWERIVNLLPF